jgi:hypothetical protein
MAKVFFDQAALQNNQEALKVILLALSEQFKQRLYPAKED